MPHYLDSLQDSIAQVNLAEVDALAKLPEHIRQEHLQLIKHSIEGWNALMAKYPHNREIEALAIAAEHRLKVGGLRRRIEQDQRIAANDGVIDLTLGKTRPSFAGHGRHKGKD